MATKRAENKTPAQAKADAFADQIEQTDAGPVLHVPTSIEEATEVAAKEANAVSAATPEATPPAAPGTEAYHRVLAWDGPLNVEDRNKFDPLKPDIVSTNPDHVVKGS